ncbi:MAG: class II aldolase/adducin family protein [bacterium]|nr:class II aldolase/adducin family protein [bacterium]
MLHAVIYQTRPEVGAIFHGHCQEILSAAGKLGLKETRQEESYGSRELIKRVLEVLGKDDFIVMKNHGFLSLGQNMDEAGQKALSILEKCCKIMGQ